MADKRFTIQFRVQVIVELKIPAETIEDALAASASLGWSEILPGTEIADGNHKVVGVFDSWDI